MANSSYKAVKKPTGVIVEQQIKPQPKPEEVFQDNLYPTAVNLAEPEDDQSNYSKERNQQIEE